MIVDTTQTKIELQLADLRNNVVAMFTCTTNDFADWESDPAWRDVLSGFSCGLCNNLIEVEDFGTKSLDWKRGYYKGKKARHKAFDEMSAEFLVDGKYISRRGER